jgi:hypothetical protein
MALGKKFLGSKKQRADDAPPDDASTENAVNPEAPEEGAAAEPEEALGPIDLEDTADEAPPKRSLEDVDFEAIPTSTAAVERKPLGQILKEMRLVTESQIQEASAIQRQRGGALGREQLQTDLVVADLRGQAVRNRADAVRPGHVQRDDQLGPSGIGSGARHRPSTWSM